MFVRACYTEALETWTTCRNAAGRAEGGGHLVLRFMKFVKTTGRFAGSLVSIFSLDCIQQPSQSHFHFKSFSPSKIKQQELPWRRQCRFPRCVVVFVWSLLWAAVLWYCTSKAASIVYRKRMVETSSFNSKRQTEQRRNTHSSKKRFTNFELQRETKLFLPAHPAANSSPPYSIEWVLFGEFLITFNNPEHARVFLACY